MPASSTAPAPSLAELTENCGREPIHRPGAIQAYGALAVLTNEHNVTYASANLARLLGVSPEAALSQPVTGLWTDAAAAKLNDVLASKTGKPRRPRQLVGLQPRNAPGRIDLQLHWRDEHAFVEMEPTCLDGPSPAHTEGFHAGVQQLLHHLSHCTTVQGMCQSLAEEVATLFGYDRVMVYRFDSSHNGTVTAEACAPGAASFLHHAFPAADIPKNARDIYRHVVLRMIPDVGADTVPLMPAPGQAAGHSVDLAGCHLRASAAVHLQYLKNMDVTASLTLALHDRGRLWGLLACHHFAPRLLNITQRSDAQLLAQVVSTLLERKRRQQGRKTRQTLKRIVAGLTRQVRRRKHLLAGLMQGPVGLESISRAKGSCAVMHLDGLWRRVGKTPSRQQCAELLAWLAEHHPEDDIFHTNCLSEHFPPAAAYATQASGLMAIRLRQDASGWAMWFRPEVLRTITMLQEDKAQSAQAPSIWQSSPDEPPMLHPRRSFASYKKQIEKHSKSFLPEEVAAVRLLRKNLVEADLAIQMGKERLARKRLEAQKRRADLLASVGADLVASLDADKPLDRAGRTIVRQFCRWFVCYSDDGHGTWRREFATHTTAKGRIALQALHLQPTAVQACAAALAPMLREHVSVLDNYADRWLKRAPSGYRELVTEPLGFARCLLVPWVVRKKMRGFIKFVRGAHDAAFTGDDVALAEQLTEKIGTAMDNATLFRLREHEIKVRERVLGVVGHDLRNPLSAIHLANQAMRRRLSKLSPNAMPEELMARQLQFLDTLERNTRHMGRLIEDLLDLARLESGRFKLTTAPLDAKALIDAAASLFEPLAAEKGVALSTHIAQSPLPVQADEERILQVFNNLVGNALKFTPKGGSIALRVEQSGDAEVRCTVSDTGVGIDGTNLPYVFDRFWQAESEARHRQGTGLGLSIVKGIVEAHGGRVWADSVLGEGTKMSFTLPANAPAN